VTKFKTLNDRIDIARLDGDYLIQEDNRRLLTAKLAYCGLKAKFWNYPKSSKYLGVILNPVSIAAFDILIYSALSGLNQGTITRTIFRKGEANEFAQTPYLPDDFKYAFGDKNFEQWFDHTLPSPDEIPAKDDRRGMYLGFKVEGWDLPEGRVIVDAARRPSKGFSFFFPSKLQKEAAATGKVRIPVPHDRQSKTMEIGPVDAHIDPVTGLWIPRNLTYMSEAYRDCLDATTTYARFRYLQRKKEEFGGSLWQGQALIDVYTGRR